MKAIKIGTRLGRWKVTRCFNIGPYAYVDLRCTCSKKTLSYKRSLGMLVKGVSLSCGCWKQEILDHIKNHPFKGSPWKALKKERLRIQKDHSSCV